MTATVESPTRVGRFALLRELGRGAQGAVFLAQDTHLERRVALKTVAIDRLDTDRPRELVRALLDEARIVSKLQHPNLVTLHDAFETGGEPYLVFEYVDGCTLAAHIRAQGRLAPAEAASIARDALRGIASAHASQVLHRDLKPGNIMLTPAGVPRVMDFGIARYAASASADDGTRSGTPSYMAPEYVSDGTFVPGSDLFAMGVVLYEMLAGEPPVKSTNPFEVLHRIVHEPFPRPSAKNPEVDERLDAIVMKALAKRPEERYADAQDMANALDAYLAPDAVQPGADAKGTLEFLLRRMRHKSDFPALSGTIGAINRVMASDREPTAVLCSAILKDVSLTAKLLKMVNAAYFKQYGGSISTVTRAVTLLGFDNVRNVAMSLMLMEHLQNKAQASALRDEVLGTYMSGVMARDLARRLGVRDAEEAFICAMLHRLGRLLVMFYLHDEHQAIERLVRARSTDETRAAKEVLGMTYEELGTGVARSWNFPEGILASMRPVTEPVSSRTQFNQDRLRMLADMSNAMCDAVRADTDSVRAARMQSIVRKYGMASGISESVLVKVVESSVETIGQDAPLLGSLTAKSALLDKARAMAAPGADLPANPESGQAGETLDAAAQTVRLDAATGGDSPATSPANRQAALSAGLQDITNTLVASYQLNDVLRMTLETMYRGIGFQRTLLCICDAKREVLRSRLGFGEDAESIIRAGFAIPLQGPRDVFYASITQAVDLCIDDLDADNIRRYVPDWYRKAVPARGLLLLPLATNGRTVGLIYADMAEAGQMRFKPEELSLLKTLRNQALLAIRQSS